jgi:ATP-dependent exoDNAse (exonuclease V) alpha subunit
VQVACSDAQLALIEGQAGTGKSTVLVGVARAHRDEGRQIIVTSTAALAAQRLAAEPAGDDVHADAYSTAALAAAVHSGRVALAAQTTVIHDEAALACTREQHQLLEAVRASGARLILVGDPLQSQPVGAGGLWAEIEHAAVEQQVRVDLTRNVRALDPADRRDQARFREGRHEDAIRGYHDRGRVMITNDQRRAEDRALEAAYADVASTSGRW